MLGAMRALAAALLATLAFAGCLRPVVAKRGCSFAEDCAAGEQCSDGKCTAPLVEVPTGEGEGEGEGDPAPVVVDGGPPGDAGGAVATPAPCTATSQCGGGETCVLGECVVGCGDVTYAGRCDGDVLLYCADDGTDAERVVYSDCGAKAAAGAVGSCADLDGAGYMGCAVRVGDTCLDAASSTYCVGADTACVTDAQDTAGTCVAGVGRCDPSVAESQCVGDVLVGYCDESGQPYGPRCADVGGACEAGACRDVPPGGLCDGVDFRCAAGAVCVGEEVDGYGVCESGCGDVTFGGRCEGESTLQYCQGEGTATETVVTLQCTGETPVCGNLNASYAECTARVGERCVFPDSGGTPRPVGCDGPGSACLVEADTNDDGVCRAAVGSCVDPAPGASYAFTCFGGVLAYDCFEQQITGYDCAGMGGSCGDQACIGLPVGAPCAGDLLRCGSGLECATAADGIERCR